VDRPNRPIPTWLLILAVAGLSLLVFACGDGAADGTPQGEAPDDHHATQVGGLPTIALPSFWDWGSADRLETLIGSADVVFRGNVVALKNQRPVLSQPGGAESGAAAPRWGDMPVSQFEVRVDSVVAGILTPGTAVSLEQLGGVETRADGTQVRIMLSRDEPVEVGLTYLFFGSFQKDGSIVAPPFGRMKVHADGSLAAEDAWAHLGALAQLSRMHLGDAEREISAASRE
jgi:hypothetical protein